MPSEGRLVSVAGGTYRNGGGGIVDVTYVLDPGAALCFASAHEVQGGTVGPAGITVIDCCRLQHIPEVQRSLPALHLTCPGAPVDAK
jgi:hypothetical protein